MRPLIVVVTTSILAGLAMICGTVLIAMGRIEGEGFAPLLASFVGPIVMILLSVQVGDVQTKVNGHMTRLIDQATAAGSTPPAEAGTPPTNS